MVPAVRVLGLRVSCLRLACLRNTDVPSAIIEEREQFALRAGKKHSGVGWPVLNELPIILQG